MLDRMNSGTTPQKWLSLCEVVDPDPWEMGWQYKWWLLAGIILKVVTASICTKGPTETLLSVEPKQTLFQSRKAAHHLE